MGQQGLELLVGLLLLKLTFQQTKAMLPHLQVATACVGVMTGEMYR
jgi:hypothetical protein